MFPSITSAVALLGLVLLALGLRGRRVGDEPRCRRCDYNLSGIEPVRCPECGRDLTPRRIRRGRRLLRRRGLVLGLILLGGVGAGRSRRRTRPDCPTICTSTGMAHCIFTACR